MNTLEIIQEVFGNNEVSEKWLEKQFTFASKIWEMGIKEGMRREHAMWQLAKIGQEIEANHCERCGKKLGTEVTDIHTCTPKEIQPVAWCIIENDRVHGLVKSKPTVMNSEKWQPLYTTPQKKEWVGLTDEEVHTIIRDTPLSIFRAIEAKLKEKNNG